MVRPEGSNLEEGAVVVVVVGVGGTSTPLLLSPYAVMPNRMELFCFRICMSSLQHVVHSISTVSASMRANETISL